MEARENGGRGDTDGRHERKAREVGITNCNSLVYFSITNKQLFLEPGL